MQGSRCAGKDWHVKQYLHTLFSIFRMLYSIQTQLNNYYVQTKGSKDDECTQGDSYISDIPLPSLNGWLW